MLLFEDGILGVKIPPLVVFGFSELSIFDDDALSLLSSPALVGQLLVLLGLPLHALQDLGLPPLFLHVVQEVHLVRDHSHSPALTVLARLVIKRFLGLAPQTDRSQSHSSSFGHRASETHGRPGEQRLRHLLSA